MTHPLTPPPELVQQWWEEADQYQDDLKTYFDHVATEAARWGWDQREPEIQADVDAELEACCEWLSVASNHGLGWDLATILSGKLRAARRPRPPSLKELALNALHTSSAKGYLKEDATSIIFRALEALPDD